MVVNHRGDIVSGGVERRLIQLAKDSGQYDIDLCVALPEHGPLEDTLLRLNIPVKVIDLSWQPRTSLGRNRYFSGFGGRVDELARWIEEQKVDIVHTNTLNLFEGAVAAMRTRRPHVWHIRSVFGTDPDPYAFGGLDIPLETQAQIVGWLADDILSVSPVASEVLTRIGIPVCVIPNGIDVAEFREVAAAHMGTDIRAELGLSKATPLIASIARLSREKDLGTFVTAAWLIHEHLPEAHFLIVGNKSENPDVTAEVEGKIRKLGLTDHVHIVGSRDDLAALYPQLNVVMITSLNEGLSNVALEAMASGIPIVSTRCGGPETLLEEGRSGLFAAVGDSQGLAAAALRCLREEELRLTLTTRARERAESTFSQSTHLASIRSYYANVLSSFKPEEQARRRALSDVFLNILVEHAAVSLDKNKLKVSKNEKTQSTKGMGRRLYECIRRLGYRPGRGATSE